MHNRITTRNGFAQRFHLQQVAGDGLGLQAGEVFELAARTNEEA
jgi:hypothetical protein